MEPSYVTRSELVEGKLNKSGKTFDKVSGLLFFGQKKKARNLMVLELLSQLSIIVVMVG